MDIDDDLLLKIKAENVYKPTAKRAKTERLFARVNHKNELYSNMISFQNEANRIYVSDINIVIFKQLS